MINMDEQMQWLLEDYFRRNKTLKFKHLMNI